MLESIKQYFQDWSDACEYANECAPDLSFLKIGEPYTAMATIALACFLLWAANERLIRRRQHVRKLESARGRDAPQSVAESPESRTTAGAEKLAA
jgi:hypothetical protein